MGRAVEPERTLSPDDAQERLGRLSAYAELPGGRGAALRELRARHDGRPVTALEAYCEAVALLGPELERFEAWSTSPDACWSRWPCVERLELERRVRMTAPVA